MNKRCYSCKTELSDAESITAWMMYLDLMRECEHKPSEFLGMVECLWPSHCMPSDDGMEVWDEEPYVDHVVVCGTCLLKMIGTWIQAVYYNGHEMLMHIRDLAMRIVGDQKQDDLYHQMEI